MPNDLLVTTTDILGIEVAKDYSGASGIYVDNVNNIISITGDVGKEYNGIEPIVVNNEENLISANSAPIGVQEPLYFVQDDDEAVIIGLSGEYVTPSDIAGKLDTSSFESWQQGQYTNDLTALQEKINEVSSNIPSIEGLATEQFVEETSASIVSQIPSTAGLASETYVQEQVSGKASKSDLESVSGDIVNLIPDVSNFYTKDETSGASQLAEAFANIPLGDEEVNALVHSNSGTWNTVTGKLDTTAFSDVSGTFLTAHQSLSNYYTKDETSGKEELAQAFANIPAGDSEVNSYVHNNSAAIDEATGLVQSNSSTWNDITVYQSNSASYLTAHQSLDGYATQDWVTAQGYLTGVSIPESATWQDVSTTVQTNSADWASHQDLSYISAQVDNKLDSTAFNLPDSATWNEVSTAYQNASATYLTAVDLTPYATTAEVESISSMLSGAIDYVSANAGDEFPVSADEAIQYVQTNSANIDDTVTSYQTNSGTFLTAHQAISAEEWNDCYDNVNTNSGAWGGEALPISSRDGIDLEVDNGTLYIGASALTGSIYAYEQNSASYLVENNFEYDGNDLITAYNGSAFAGQGGGGGGDVPTGTMNVTGLEYNAVNEISGYNGSAIAQYGAEKQWLVHDDTLVHASNSAQYALGVNVSALKQLMGIDKTVLWEGRVTATDTPTQLSEPLTAFGKLEFVLELDNLGNKVDTYLASGQTYSFSYSYPFQGTFRHDMAWLQFNEDYKTWQFISANHRAWNTAGDITETYNNWQWTFYTLKQIIGVGRKQV